MGATVFISHSSKDQKVARAVCTALENRGFTCWIASRDVDPGQNFQEAIVRAIRAAKVMILVFSENANNSDEIKKELVLANQSKVAVIPVRVEDVVPNEALAYEFATRQWIDLFEDWEQAIARLSSRIAAIAPSTTEATKPQAQEGYATAPAKAPVTGILSRPAAAFDTARRAVPAVGFSIGAACVAGLVAFAMLLTGYARVSAVIFGGMLLAMLIVTVLARLLSSPSAATRRAGGAAIWAVSLLFVTFLALTATAVGFRWPAGWASALGYEDGVVCSRPTELTEVFSCGSKDGTYIVANILVDDADGGLVVREGPGVGAIRRGFIPPNGTDLAVGNCAPEATDAASIWCQVQCDSRNLKGWSRKRYMLPRSEALYAVTGTDPSDPKGLSIRTGPDRSCRANGVVPYQGRNVIVHGCQPSPIDRSAIWCRITYQARSGWVMRGFLDRQN